MYITRNSQLGTRFTAVSTPTIARCAARCVPQGTPRTWRRRPPPRGALTRRLAAHAGERPHRRYRRRAGLAADATTRSERAPPGASGSCRIATASAGTGLGSSGGGSAVGNQKACQASIIRPSAIPSGVFGGSASRDSARSGARMVTSSVTQVMAFMERATARAAVGSETVL